MKQNSKSNKKFIWVALGVTLAVLIIGVVAKKSMSSEEKFVLSEEAQLRTIKQTVSANGKVQPEVEVKLSAEISGEIIELPVKEGNQVSKGDLIVRINPDVFLAARNRAEAAMNSAQANAANAKARLAQANAQLINAEASFNRTKKLLEDQAVSQAEYDQAFSQFEVAKAEVEAARESLKAAEFNVKSGKASLKEADDNLKRTTILAPMDGTVSKLDAEVGERVVGTSQMAGTEIMRIADLTQMEVNVEVNESDIVKVKLGDKAEIEIDAYVDRKFEGTVTEIANSSSSTNLQSTDQITVFDVKVRIERASYQDLVDANNAHLSPFRPGMSATVDIHTNQAENAITVPIQAVTVRADSAANGNKTSKFGKGVDLSNVDDDDITECVFILRDGKAVMQEVKIGIQDNKYIQILEGLEKGDVVISGPYAMVSKQLKNGDKVSAGSREQVYKFEE